MKFQTSLLCASAVLAGSALADVVADKPTFSPAAIKAPFIEQFTDDWETRWTPSHAKKEDSKSDEDWAYVGEWAVEEPSVYPGIVGDKGLVVKNAAAHHAISAKFAKPIDPKGKNLVVQYEVKLQNGLECGGAYMKLLQNNKALASEEFSNASPYVIMFGPDKCGTTNKVHFIFKHKNPKTGEYEEKHLKSPPQATISKLTTLYTLIVKPDNTFEILVDNKSVKSGSLLEDFSPAVNPEKEIDDPNDTKPADWVDLARMPDPEATKPEDWDEDAPYEVVDTEAEKPDDWLEDEPLTIADPEAEKPEDWDDEEDGDWIPPQVPNPKCEEASGCGKWEPPMKKNPDYKGKWTVPQIDNPDYKGPWAPRKVPNPAYFDDKTPSNFEPMGAIGFEIWTMQNNILFDNIYIGHSVDDAAALVKETYDVKHTIEKAEETAAAPPPEPEKPASPLSLSFKDDPVTYVREKLDLFVTLAKRDPVEAIKFMPEVAGAIGVGIVTVLGVLILAIGGGAAAAPSKEELKKTAQKAKAAATDAKDKAVDAATEAKDKVVDAAASGAETVKAEANKRTTRSQGSN